MFINNWTLSPNFTVHIFISSIYNLTVAVIIVVFLGSSPILLIVKLIIPLNSI